MSAVWDHSRASGTELLVLLAIADVANDDGLCTAYGRSQTVLARKCRVSEQTIRRATHNLVAGAGTLKGRPELELLERGDGRRSSSYRVRLEVLAEGYQSGTPQPAAAEDGGLSPVTPQGFQSDTPGLSPVIAQGYHPRDPHLSVLPRPGPSSSVAAGGGRLEPELRRQAEAVLNPWWERQHPRPAQPYPAARKAVAELLRAGWTAEQIGDVLEAGVPTLTVGWLEGELRRATGRVRRPLARVDEAIIDNRRFLEEVLDRQEKERRHP